MRRGEHNKHNVYKFCQGTTKTLLEMNMIIVPNKIFKL
jgi:hypothetical protein